MKFSSALGAAVAALLSVHAQAAEPRPIEVGIVADPGFLGEEVMRGAQLAVEEFERRKDVRVTLIVERAKDPEPSSEAALRLRDKFVAFALVQGDFASAALRAAFFRQPYFVLDSYLPMTIKDRESAYRMNGLRENEPALIQQQLTKLLADTSAAVAILPYEQNPALFQISEDLHDLLDRTRKRAVRKEPLPASKEAAEAFGKRLLTGPKTALVIIAPPAETNLILEGLGEAQIQTPVIVASYGCTPLLAEAARGLPQLRAICVVPTVKNSAYGYYELKHGQPPSYQAALAYDAVVLGVIGVKECRGRVQPECFNRAIIGRKNFPGFSGEKSFEPDSRTAADLLSVMTVREEKLVPAVD